MFKAFQESGRTPYETMSPAETRELYLKGRVVTNPEPPALRSVQALATPSPAGPIPARIYTPAAVDDAVAATKWIAVNAIPVQHDRDFVRIQIGGNTP